MFEQLATSEALLATAEANLIASHSSQLPEFLINFSNFMYSNPVAANLITIIFYLWIAVWKCLALWKAAQLKQKGWFIGLFVINSLGILEIAYLFFFSKLRNLDSTLPPNLDLILISFICSHYLPFPRYSL